VPSNDVIRLTPIQWLICTVAGLGFALRVAMIEAGCVTAQEFAQDVAGLGDPSFLMPSALLWASWGRRPWHSLLWGVQSTVVAYSVFASSYRDAFRMANRKLAGTVVAIAPGKSRSGERSAPE